LKLDGFAPPDADSDAETDLAFGWGTSVVGRLIQAVAAASVADVTHGPAGRTATRPWRRLGPRS
jgi:hypothetical protein